MYTFVPNKAFGRLLEILLMTSIFLKAFKSEFSVWFTDQNSQPLEIKDKFNLFDIADVKMCYSI